MSDAGRKFFANRGIGPLADRVGVGYCVDWTEQRHHLSGEPGRAILRHMLDQRWLTRDRSSRALRVTEAGRGGLRELFEIDWA